MPSLEEEASSSDVSANPPENEPSTPGSELYPTENGGIGETPISKLGDRIETSCAEPENRNMGEILWVSHVSDASYHAQNTFTGPTVQPLLRLASDTNNSFNREHYPCVCIDSRSDVSIIAADCGSIIPWPADHTITWNLFGVEFTLEGVEVRNRDDMPIEGVDGVFGLGFLRHFYYMSFQSTPEGYMIPSEYSLYPLLPCNSSDQRTLKIYTDVVSAQKDEISKEDWTHRPSVGVGVFVGHKVSLNTWIPCFGDYIGFLCNSDRQKQDIIELITITVFLGILDAVKGRLNIAPFVRIELYTNQEALVIWRNSISKGEIPKKHPMIYADRFISLRKELAVDMGSNEDDCIDIISYGDSVDPDRARIGREQAKALAKLALKSSKSDEVPYHEYCYLKYLKPGVFWVSKKEMDMTMDGISTASEELFKENDRAQLLEDIPSDENITTLGPETLHSKYDSNNYPQKVRENGANYIQPNIKTDPDALKRKSGKLSSLLRKTDQCENGPLIIDVSESMLDNGAKIDDNHCVEVFRASGVHVPEAKTTQDVSQLNETYEASRDEQSCIMSVECRANKIISKAQEEADKILSQAKMLWVEGIDSHAMASAMATKTRLDAEADAQEIKLQVMKEAQKMRSQALEEIISLRKRSLERFENGRPDLNPVTLRLEYNEHSPELIIEEAKEKAKEILQNAERRRKDMLEEAAEWVRLAKEDDSEDISEEDLSEISKESRNVQLVKSYFTGQNEKMAIAQEALRNAEKDNEVETQTARLVESRAQVSAGGIAEMVQEGGKMVEAEIWMAESGADLIAKAEKAWKGVEENEIRAQKILEDATLEAERMRKEVSEIIQQGQEQRDKLEKELCMRLADREEVTKEQELLIQELTQEKAELLGQVISLQKQSKTEATKALEKAEETRKGAETAKKEAESAKRDIETLKETAKMLRLDVDMKKKETEEARKEADAVKESVEKAWNQADLIRAKAETDAANIREQALKVKKEAEDSKSRVIMISEKIKAEAREEATKIKAQSDKIIREAETKKQEAAKMSKKILSEAEKLLQIRKDDEITFAIAMEVEKQDALRAQEEMIAKKMAETNRICEEMKRNSAEKIKDEYKRFEEEQERGEKSKKNFLLEIASQKKKAKDEAQKILDKAWKDANQIIRNTKKAQDDHPIRGDVLGSALPLTPENFYKMFLEPKDSNNDGPLSAEDFIKLLETAEAEVTLGQIVNHCPEAAREFFVECEREERLVHKIELYTDITDQRLKFKKGERIIPLGESQ